MEKVLYTSVVSIQHPRNQEYKTYFTPITADASQVAYTRLPQASMKSLSKLNILRYFAGVTIFFASNETWNAQ